MATRSTIALEFADGTVQQVYCHWDGYLEHNGKILNEHFADPFKVRELIVLGDLSQLNPEIGEKHDFDNPTKGYCVFYGRDRGEEDIDSRKFINFEDYLKNHQSEDYNYILRNDGNWYVSINSGFERLTSALAELEEE